MKPEEFSNIKTVDELFKQYSNKFVYALILGGNKGDGLIYFGGRTLFKKYNVKFKEVNSLKGIKSKTLMVYGGGGYCKSYHGKPKMIKPFMKNFEEIFILPSSFDCDMEYIKNFIMELPKKVYVFCREKYSHEQVLKYSKFKDNIRLDHDLAFHINYNNYKLPGKGLLSALRNDKEKLKVWNLPYKNEDISLGGNHNNFNDLFKKIQNYDTVITDRAHISICSSMLGKKTIILNNAYHKVKGIYEYSLKDKPNVYFVNDESDIIKVLNNQSI